MIDTTRPDGVAKIVRRLQACADDPMWADHAEVSKTLLRAAIAALAAQHPSQSAGEPVAWRLERRNTITGEWQVDLQEGWADGQPIAELVRSVSENAENYRFKFAYASPPPTDAARVEADRRDAERWRLLESASSTLTLRVHNTQPGEPRRAVIDAALAAERKEQA